MQHYCAWSKPINIKKRRYSLKNKKQTIKISVTLLVVAQAYSWLLTAQPLQLNMEITLLNLRMSLRISFLTELCTLSRMVIIIMFILIDRRNFQPPSFQKWLMQIQQRVVDTHWKRGKLEKPSSSPPFPSSHILY